MSQSSISAAEFERYRLKAAAEIQLRKEEDRWEGTIQAHTAYQQRPVEWIVEYLGIPENTIRWSLNPGYSDHTWDGDKDPIVRILEAIGRGEDCGVESATGTGKTFCAACVILWFLAVWEDALVLSIAPKKDQLLTQVWKEIGDLWPRFERHFPQAELLTGKIRMRPGETEGGKEKWTATAFVCGVGADEESANKARGFHAEHMLLVSEETPGIHRAIMEAFEQTRTDDHNIHLALGNPDHQQDSLHLFCEQDWVTNIRISTLDHPNIVSSGNIIPGAIGKRRLVQRTERLGEGTRLYEAMVRGISPAESEDALVKLAWCRMAANRYGDEELRDGLPALGVDVADEEGGDHAAIARWQGACLTEVKAFHCNDANLLGKHVFEEAIDEGIEPRHIGVDAVGVGAGTWNELKRLGMKVQKMSGARKAAPLIDVDSKWAETENDEDGNVVPKGPRVVEAERFNNQRSSHWWRMREDLRKGLIALPEDKELWNDLITPTYETRNGIIVVESKEEIKKRLKRSPNKGDAVVYGNAVRRRRPVGVRRRDDPIPKSTSKRDYGLERLIRDAEKRRKAERRKFHKALRGGRR